MGRNNRGGDNVEYNEMDVGDALLDEGFDVAREVDDRGVPGGEELGDEHGEAVAAAATAGIKEFLDSLTQDLSHRCSGVLCLVIIGRHCRDNLAVKHLSIYGQIGIKIRTCF